MTGKYFILKLITDAYIYFIYSEMGSVSWNRSALPLHVTREKTFGVTDTSYISKLFSRYRYSLDVTLYFSNTLKITFNLIVIL